MDLSSFNLLVKHRWTLTTITV